jgi:hypothetical protein
MREFGYDDNFKFYGPQSRAVWSDELAPRLGHAYRSRRFGRGAALSPERLGVFGRCSAMDQFRVAVLIALPYVVDFLPYIIGFAAGYAVRAAISRARRRKAQRFRI